MRSTSKEAAGRPIVADAPAREAAPTSEFAHPVDSAAHERSEASQGFTIYGDTRKVIDRLRGLQVPLSAVEFLPSCDWALYVKPGAIVSEQIDTLRQDFQVARGRC